MGIDLEKHHVRKHRCTQARGRNPYMKLLVTLYSVIARRTQSQFAQIVLHRMCSVASARPMISTSRISKAMKKHEDDYIAVCVCNVVNDPRFMPKKNMTVCALKFTRAAENAIKRAGGQCIRFDELALKAPTGVKTVLLRGRKGTKKQVMNGETWFGACCFLKNYMINKTKHPLLDFMKKVF